MAGRKPKPTALRIAEGNPGKRPINDREPTPEVGEPDCPEHLHGDAREEWRRIVPLLLDLGLLSRVDRSALACYCVAWGRHLAAEKQLSRNGRLTVETENGNAIPNPLIGISNTAAKLAHKFLIEFGLTPSTRSRLRVSKAEKSQGEKLQEFMRIAQ
jgi:P27 family predicted phage terminase small subunit